MKMTVDLKEHSYPIYIERGILEEAAERIAEKRLRKIFLKNMSVRKP